VVRNARAVYTGQFGWEFKFTREDLADRQSTWLQVLRKPPSHSNRGVITPVRRGTTARVTLVNGMDGRAAKGVL
jgi:hypothetical protein